MHKVCPDCSAPAPDQRDPARDGRCRNCKQQILRDRRRRTTVELPDDYWPDY